MRLFVRKLRGCPSTETKYVLRQREKSMTDEHDSTNGTADQKALSAEEQAFRLGLQVGSNRGSAASYKTGYNDGVEAAHAGDRVYMVGMPADAESAHAYLAGMPVDCMLMTEDATTAARNRQAAKASASLATNIGELRFWVVTKLSLSTCEILLRENLCTINDVLECGAEGLLRSGFDYQGLAEVVMALAEVGYALG